VTCSHCGTEVRNPHSCSYCEREFCDDHRLPENHDCPFQAHATRPSSDDGVQEGSGVEEPEPLDLESRSSGPSRSPPTSSSPAVELKQSDETSSSSEPEKRSRRGLDLEVAKIRFGGIVRNLVRLVGLVAVFLGAYHLLGPFIDPTLPMWAPWRVIGARPLLGSGAIYYPADVFMIAIGTFLTWFV
jgi:hypothetical protein